MRSPKDSRYPMRKTQSSRRRLPHEAVGRPRQAAKAAGIPNSVMSGRAAVSARALRASRWFQGRREWARCTRKSTTGGAGRDGWTVVGSFTSTRWLRSNCMQARRCALRGQSLQSSRDAPPVRGCEPHAHPAWMLGLVPVPLTLRTLRASTTVGDPSLIDDAQAPVPLPTAFLWEEPLSCWARYRPIWLERKILSS